MSITKSQAAHLIKEGTLTEVFEHATMGRFNVSLIRMLVLATAKRGTKPYRCKFSDVRAERGDPNPMTFLADQREIDDARVSQLTEAELEDPVIFVDCPPGLNGVGKTQLLIDGVHRLTARHRRGYEDFAFWLIPHATAMSLSQGLEAGINIPWGTKEVRDGKLVDREV